MNPQPRTTYTLRVEATPARGTASCPEASFDFHAPAANCPLPAPRPRECAALATANATLLLDDRGVVCWSSPAAGHLLGFSDHELHGRAARTLLPGLPLREHTRGYNVAYATLQSRAGHLLHLDAIDARGEVTPLNVSIGLAQDPGGTTLVLALARHCAPGPAFADLHRFVAALADKPEAAAITDRDGTVRYANRAYEALTGAAPGGALARHVFCNDETGQARERFARVREALDQRREVRGIHTWRGFDGTRRHVGEAARPFVDAFGNVTHYVFTLRDATARVEDVARLAHLAHHDALTGLPNRVLFNDRMQQELARALRAGAGFTLMCLDIDGFKTINDQHGHAAGDTLLCALAAALRRTVREQDMVARLGGDEFAVILAGTSRRDDAVAVADALRSHCKDELRHEGSTSTVSIGAARFPFDGADAAALLHAADGAMYRAKRAGGDRHAFADEVLAADAEKPVLAGDRSDIMN